MELSCPAEFRPKYPMRSGPADAQKLLRENWNQGEEDLECEVFLNKNSLNFR